MSALPPPVYRKSVSLGRKKKEEELKVPPVHPAAAPQVDPETPQVDPQVDPMADPQATQVDPETPQATQVDPAVNPQATQVDPESPQANPMAPKTGLVVEPLPVEQLEPEQKVASSFWDTDEDALTISDDDKDALHGTYGQADNTESSQVWKQYQNRYSSNPLSPNYVPPFMQNLYETAETLDKYAHSINKGLAGMADLATTPLWAATWTIMPDGTANTMPFSKMLEAKYPSKLYAFEEDPNTYADEFHRVGSTMAEWGSGGVMAPLAKLGTKGASQLSTKMETIYGAVAGFGYQSMLENGQSELAAMGAAFLAPMSKSVVTASWDMTTKTTKGVFNLAKQSPTLGIPFRATSDYTHKNLVILRSKLETQPELWESTWFSRQAKAQILKVPDTPKTVKQQISDLETARDALENTAPFRNPMVAAHAARMKRLQDLINKGRPEDSQLNLQMDQIYTPIMSQMNDTKGFSAMLDSILITNGEAYTQALRKNHEVFQDILKGETGHITTEDAEAFNWLFKDHLDQLLKEEERIKAVALGMDPTASATVPGATVYGNVEIPQAELTNALDQVRTAMFSAYGEALGRLPKDVELDTTPMKNAIIEMYENMGAFSDPKDVPSYLKSLMKQMIALGGKTETKGVHKDLLNREAELTGAKKDIAEELQGLASQHRVKLESIPADTPAKEAKALQKQYEAEYKQEKDLLAKKKRPIDDELTKLEVTKREYRGSDVTLDFKNIPEPTFTDVGSITEALKIVNDMSRKAFKRGEWQQVDNLDFMKRGLEKTLAGLEEVDQGAYEQYQIVKSRYGELYSRDYQESKAGLLTDKKGGREIALTTGKAADELWVNSDIETIQRVMRNFDPERNGLEEYLGTTIVKQNGEDVFAVDAVSDYSKEGVAAMRDLIFTDMAHGLEGIELTKYKDPTDKIAAIEEYMLKYYQQYKNKLRVVPGFENTTDNIRQNIEQLSEYRRQIADLNEQQNSSLLKNVTGPGYTIMDLAKSRAKADEFVEMMEELAKETPEAMGPLIKSMFGVLVKRHTKGTKLEHDDLFDLLESNVDARHNLSLVLGEEQVGKLLGMAHISKAISTGETTFTESLTQDRLLKAMEQHGVSMGKLGSLLGRRAVFAPSGAYVASAFTAKVIDSLGADQTSKMLRILFDNPFDLTEMDNFVIKELDRLNARQAAIVEKGLARRSLEGTVAILEPVLASALHTHLVSLGLEVTESELAEIAREFLTTPIEESEETGGNQ